LEQFKGLAAEIVFDRHAPRVRGRFVNPMFGEDHALHGNRSATESRRRQKMPQFVRYGKRAKVPSKSPRGGEIETRAGGGFSLVHPVGLALCNTLPATPLLGARGHKI
jgi:hypothetical protein